MSTRLLYIVLACTVLFASCKKKTDDTAPTAAPLAKIKTTSYDLAGFSYTYYYNSLGMLDSAIGSMGDKEIYTYTASTVTRKGYNTDGVTLLSTYTFFLNSQLRADSITFGDGTSNRFEYDAEGYRIVQKLYDATNTLTVTRRWVINNGNVTDFYNFTTSGTLLQQYHYTYGSQLNTSDIENNGLSLYGKQSKNAVDTYFEFDPPNGGRFLTYAYTYDSQNRTTNIKIYKNDGTLFNSLSYTYY